MIRKELATAIVLSAALGVTACKTAEPIPEEDNTEMVEESSEPVDTTAPDIRAKNNINPVNLGTKITASNYVEVEDESDVTVYFVAEDGDQLTLEIPTELDKEVTEINYTFVAVDVVGNRSKEINIMIPINHPEEEKKAESKGVVEETPEYKIEPMDDTKYYAIQTCNVRSGPSTSYDTVRQLALNEEIIVNGKVQAENGKEWCVIKTEDDSIQMVSASLVSTEKISTKKPSSGNSGNANSNTGNNIMPQTPSDCYSDCAVGDCEGFCDIPGLANDCDFACFTDCCNIAAE